MVTRTTPFVRQEVAVVARLGAAAAGVAAAVNPEHDGEFAFGFGGCIDVEGEAVL